MNATSHPAKYCHSALLGRCLEYVSCRGDERQVNIGKRQMPERTEQAGKEVREEPKLQIEELERSAGTLLSKLATSAT